MRLLLPTLAAALVAAVAIPALSARADGPAAPEPTARIALLELQVKSLRADVEYLRSREISTSHYLQSLSTAVQNLSSGIARSRQEGFEAAAISGPSRVALLRTLDTLAADLSAGIPIPSQQELRLRAQADDLRKEVPR